MGQERKLGLMEVVVSLAASWAYRQIDQSQLIRPGGRQLNSGSVGLGKQLRFRVIGPWGQMGRGAAEPGKGARGSSWANGPEEDVELGGRHFIPRGSLAWGKMGLGDNLFSFGVSWSLETNGSRVQLGQKKKLGLREMQLMSHSGSTAP